MIQYEYDQVGRRIAMSMTGPNSEPTRKWVYRDCLRIAAELDSWDNVASRFLYSAGKMPVQMIRGNTAYLLVADYLGSLRAVVRLLDGEIMQSMEYDEFGRVIVDDVVNGFERVPFGYAGGLYDRGTGLVRFGAREYDAQAGRWVSKDPVGLGAGSNVYEYCGDDPADCVDPVGLSGMLTLWVLDHPSAFQWGHVFVTFQPDGSPVMDARGSYPLVGPIDDSSALFEAMYGIERVAISHSEWIDDAGEQKYNAFLANSLKGVDPVSVWWTASDPLVILQWYMAWGPWSVQGECGTWGLDAFEAATGKSVKNRPFGSLPGGIASLLRAANDGEPFLLP